MRVTAWAGAPEKDFMSAVIELAKLRRWLVYHTHDSRRSEPGFPDLVLVRDRVLFAELKTEKGKITRDQTNWMERLRAAGADAHIWRPQDWDEIEAALR